LLSKNLFGKRGQCHSHFALTDATSGKRLDNGVEVHTLELLKYNLKIGDIHRASKIEKWVFYLLHAHEYDAEELRVMLPDDEFQPAIDELEKISKKTKDRMMYSLREKAQRDYEWGLWSAKTEGRKEGREEGREEGRLTGKIQVLQELLGEDVSTDEALLNRPMDELAAMASQLQMRLRKRD
jgi:predicted transposase/invertase (TIGR01784 family)